MNIKHLLYRYSVILASAFMSTHGLAEQNNLDQIIAFQNTNTPSTTAENSAVSVEIITETAAQSILPRTIFPTNSTDTYKHVIPLKNVRALMIDGAGYLEVRIGKASQLTFYATAETVPHITVTQFQKRLNIIINKPKAAEEKFKPDAHFILEVPDIHFIGTHDNSVVLLKNADLNYLKVNTYGTSQLDLEELNITKFIAETKLSSLLTISNVRAISSTLLLKNKSKMEIKTPSFSENLSLKAVSSAVFYGPNFTAEVADVHAATKANITVNVTDVMTGKLQNNSQVTLLTEPSSNRLQLKNTSKVSFISESSLTKDTL